jgi:hypothetical protein
VKPLASLAGNFAHLKAHDEQLLRLGLLAERYFTEDPRRSGNSWRRKRKTPKPPWARKWLRCKPNPRRKGRTELPVS